MTTTQTEQQSLDALLADEIPPELREALTMSWPMCQRCGYAAHSIWHTATIPDHAFDAGKRVPLPLDSAHVAAERWCTLRGWRITIEPELGVSVLDSEGLWSEADDIFAAIGAALKGGE